MTDRVGAATRPARPPQRVAAWAAPAVTVAPFLGLRGASEAV